MTAPAPSAAEDGATDRWVEHDGLRLHAVDARPASRRGDAFVFVPGLGEAAEEHRPLLAALAPRRAVAVDLRGRGASDVPASGYDLDHHVGDLAAVVDALDLARLHLGAFSRGCGYALAYALAHPDRVASLVLADYRAHHVALFPGFADMWMSKQWRGRPMGDRLDRRVADGLEREATGRPMWDDLPGLDRPLLVVRGGRRSAVLDAAGADEYRRRAPRCEVVVFEDSGHDLWRPDPDRFARTIREFLERVDPS